MSYIMHFNPSKLQDNSLYFNILSLKHNQNNVVHIIFSKLEDFT